MQSLQIIDAFTKYLADEKHFSPYTARCYGADLRQFVDYLVDELGISVDPAKEQAAASATVSPGQVLGPGAKTATVTEAIRKGSSEFIRDFLAFLGEQQYSAATMARKIATLRSFYKWADRRGIAAANPMTAASSTKMKSARRWICHHIRARPQARLPRPAKRCLKTLLNFWSSPERATRQLRMSPGGGTSNSERSRPELRPSSVTVTIAVSSILGCESGGMVVVSELRKGRRPESRVARPVPPPIAATLRVFILLSLTLYAGSWRY